MFTATVQRRIASLVLVTFTSLTLQPLQAAVMAGRKEGIKNCLCILSAGKCVP